MASSRHDMTDAEWLVPRSVLPTGRQGPMRKNDRRVFDGIFFVLRSGIPWRDLPRHYGPYTTCCNRCNRWSKDGTWSQIMEKLQRLVGQDDGPDGGGAGHLKTRMIDSSAVRVHKHGAGSRRDAQPRHIGRSRGGLTTKIHVAVDGGGHPTAMRLSPGQVADCTQALALLGNDDPAAIVIGDKAYDTDAIVTWIKAGGGVAVIPSRSHRKTQRPLDRKAYASRNRVERFFARIKEFRRVATRYDKRARNFLSAVTLAAARCILRNLAQKSIESTA